MILNRTEVKTIVGLFLFVVWATSLSSSFVRGQQSQAVENDSPAKGGPQLIEKDVGKILAIHQVDDTLLLSTEKALYRWNDKLEGKPEIAIVSATRQFFFYQEGDSLLFGTDGGLYRWNVRLEGKPEIVDTSMGLPRRFHKIGGTVLIGAEKGLYRWNRELKGKPELVDTAVIKAYRFHPLGSGALLLSAPGGLYRWNVKLEGRPERVSTEVGSLRSLHQADGIILLGTVEGLFRWNENLEGSPEPLDTGMGGIVSFHQVGDTLLISADNGLYRWNGRLEGRPTLIDAEVRTVLAFQQLGDTLLLGGDEGVYRWNAQLEGRPTLIFREAGGIASFQQMGGALLIDGVEGLYRWNVSLEDRPERVGEAIGFFHFSHQMDGTLLIGTGGGLYQWNNRFESSPQPVVTAMRHILSFHQTEGGLWIGTEKGLYKWNDRLEGEPQLVDVSSEFISEPITALYQTGGTLLLGLERGLLRWNDRLEGPPTVDLGPEHVLTIHHMDGTILIGTDKGLYRWNEKLEGRPISLDTVMGGISAFHQVGDILLVGAPGGLYQWNVRLEGKPELLDPEVGSIDAFHQTGDTLLIGTKLGLFKINGVGIKWNADIEVAPLTGTILSKDGVTVKWIIRNYEQRANPQNVRIRLIVKDNNNTIVSRDADGNSINPEQWQVPVGQQQLTMPRLPAGVYRLIVQATDLTGNTSESAPVNFKVYSSLEEVALDWGKYLTLLYACLTVLLFLILVLGARRSRRCFDLLTDPVVRKLGVYFGFALRHVRPIRLWVFERYFDELKKDWSGNNIYVPYHLIPSDESFDGATVAHVESTRIIKRLRRETRVLLLGGPGTGKSALVDYLMRTYCREPSLRDAWKKYGFIPVVVRLRELAGGSPGVKVTELARSALSGKGMTFNPEDSFFELLLRNSDFLIILDGLNEINVDEAVDEFAVTHLSVRLLTTSQTNSLSVSFKRYILPFFDSRFAQELLRKFVGDGPAKEAIEEAPELWHDIKCGYDVRLVEYLIKSSTAKERQTSTSGKASTILPKNRLELYRAMIEFSKRRYEQSAIQMKGFPYARICERAWNMWRNGQYVFQPDESLPQPEVEHLVRTNLVIKHAQGYEFMHSLMRDFLGAEFCTRHSGPTKLMIQTRLQGEDADKIWKLPPSDQAPLFSFLTESIEEGEDLQEIFQFASERVKERYQLMIAVQEAAKRKGWQIEVNINVE